MCAHIYIWRIISFLINQNLMKKIIKSLLEILISSLCLS